MTQPHDPPAGLPAGESLLPPPAPPGDDRLVTYQVQVQPATAAVLRAVAAREGADPAALAALWLEEKAADARRLLGSSPSS